MLNRSCYPFFRQSQSASFQQPSSQQITNDLQNLLDHRKFYSHWRIQTFVSKASGNNSFWKKNCLILAKAFNQIKSGFLLDMPQFYTFIFVVVFTDKFDELALGLTRFPLNKRTQGYGFSIFTWLAHCTLHMAYILMIVWILITVFDLWDLWLLKDLL